MSAPKRYQVSSDEFIAAFARQEQLKNYTVVNGPLDTPCHVFGGREVWGGYSGITYKGKSYYGHRLAWIRAHAREIPTEMWCLHLCERPPCINPTHLYIGTPRDNTLDRFYGTDRQRTETTMQTLYNCKRITKDHYRITKFDDGLVPYQHHDGTLSSYVCSDEGCDCPQGHKPSCRHRKMLPFFIEEEHVDDNYFFIWETHQWFKATGIFAEAAKANGKGPEAQEITTQIEGGPKPASAAPSPQPSRMRRF